MGPPGRAFFGPQVHNLNKLGRGLLDVAKNIISVVLDKKIFERDHLRIIPAKFCDNPPGGLGDFV